MAKPTKDDDSFNLTKISTKFIPDNELQDPVAILFRKLLKACRVNVSKWSVLLNSHLRWEINEKDPKKAKVMRTNHLGNIKTTYFETPTLTFQKLLAGISILKFKKCEIILRVTDHEGNVTEVSESIRIASSKDSDKEEPK